MGNKYFMVLL